MRNRRFRRRYRRRARKTRYTTGGSIKYLASKAMSGVRYLKNLINVEFKTIDSTSSTTYGTTPTFYTLNAVALGDDYNNRDGRQIRIKSCQLNMDFLANPTATTDTQIRCILFLAKSPEGATPTFTDVFDSANLYSQRNLTNRKEFVILFDKIITLSPESVDKKFFKYYKKMNFKTIYNSTATATVAAVESNGLFLCMFSGDAVNPPTINFTHRCRFIDN